MHAREQPADVRDDVALLDWREVEPPALLERLGGHRFVCLELGLLSRPMPLRLFDGEDAE
jgi:hypothetical protein